VDSGADLTTISKKELVLLGYSYEWIEHNIHTDFAHTLSRAGGKPQPACYIQIPTSNILGRELTNWPFYIRQERHLDFPNLLGINILSYFNFKFDYQEWCFYIESIAIPKNTLSMLSDQSICEIGENSNKSQFTPTAETLAAIEEVKEMKKTLHLHKGFDSVDELFEELDSDG
jgi:hypothetical protein